MPVTRAASAYVPVAVMFIVMVGVVLFLMYYFMTWPFRPSLETGDPVIDRWLQNDDVTIHRQSGKLSDSRIFILQGERFEDGCSWRFSSLEGPRVSRELATNMATCESLIEEGVPED